MHWTSMFFNMEIKIYTVYEICTFPVTVSELFPFVLPICH